MANSDPRDRIVLLFSHGGSFHKQCWTPIVRRLQASPLLQRVPCVIAAFNWRFHGDKKDRSIEPTLFYRHGDKDSPRVDHPLVQWQEWSPKDLKEEIAKLREDDAKLSRRTHIIGIGHSMGATTFMMVETTHPGTLDGIISFDGGFNDGTFTDEGANEAGRDYLVGACLARKDEWDTWDDLREYFKTSASYKRWDLEAIESFQKEGVEQTEDGSRWRLVMPRAVEASLYCTDFANLGVEDFKRAQCKIVLEHAEHTVFFREDSTQAIADQLNGQLVIADVVPNTTHSMVVEQPATCAQHILEALETFPIFQRALNPAAKL